MPWMPDRMPSLPNGLANGQKKVAVVSRQRKVDIKSTENRILSSAEHLNEILSLISLLNDKDDAIVIESASSLIRIFKRLRRQGKLTASDSTTPDSPQVQIVTWLYERYVDLTHNLLNLLETDKADLQLISLTLYMRLVKDETALGSREVTKFANKTYAPFVEKILQSITLDDAVLQELCDKYLNAYYDIQFYFLQDAGKYLQQPSSQYVHQNLHRILMSLKPLLPVDETIPEMFTPLPATTSILLPTSYKAAFQSVWISHLRQPLDLSQLKQLLLIIHKRVIPYMNKPQLLMDWLTDSYNSGGSISLLALNGLWELMQKYNLDYPEFFIKLYALFNPTLFHTRYLARFLRLSDLFLSSSYLPAALVASFAKRLSRLSLTAPPHGIAAIIPMVYNLLKQHPTCMQLIHRPDALPGRPDPFNPDEPDPLKTGALESSLWELASLTNHYNPNISSLAKIFSEPFTKPNYNMEDFLDHSYGTMLEADLGRRAKRDPVVNHEKPSVFGEAGKGNKSVLEQLWEF